MHWLIVPWLIACYLIGSVSVGDWVARSKGVNIRTVGTGNPGAANIYREIGPPYGLAVFLLDGVKGLVATVPLFLLDQPAWVRLAAAAAMLTGHFFPPMTRRVGGTGMAAAMGAVAGIVPWGLVVGLPVGLLVLKAFRNAGYTGVAFFLVAAPTGALLHNDIPAGLATLGLGAVVLIKARLQYR